MSLKYGMEGRFNQLCKRSNTTRLQLNLRFCIPIFQPDRPGDNQGSSENCWSNDTSDTHIADADLIYSPTKNSHTTSIAFTNPRGKKHPLVKTKFLRLVALRFWDLSLRCSLHPFLLQEIAQKLTLCRLQFLESFLMFH